MTAIPNWALSRQHLTALTITMQDNTNGTLTDDSTYGSVSIKAVLSSFRFTSENSLEDVSSITTLNRNMVQVDSGTSMEIGVLIVANDVSGARTNDVYKKLYDGGMVYAKVGWTRAGATGIFYCIVKSYEESFTSKSKIEGTLALEMVDTGTNPTMG